jgi:hypothetical protein
MKCSMRDMPFCRPFLDGIVARKHLRFVVSSHLQSARVQTDPFSRTEGVAQKRLVSSPFTTADDERPAERQSGCSRSFATRIR